MIFLSEDVLLGQILSLLNSNTLSPGGCDVGYRGGDGDDDDDV